MYGLFPPASTSSARFVNSFSASFARGPALGRGAARRTPGGTLAGRSLRLGGLRGLLDGLGIAGAPRPAGPLLGRCALARGGCALFGLAEDPVDRRCDRLDRRHAVSRAQQPMVMVI